MKLAGKVAIVTGGGSGMGREICLEYAKEGAAVVVTSNVPSQIEAVASECRDLGGKAIAVECDVTNEGSVERLVGAAVRELGKIDILVAAAGIGYAHIGAPTFTTVMDSTLEQWNKIFAVNVMGVYLSMREVIPAMRRNGGGSIMAFSSGTVRFPPAGLAPYTASKWAVEGLVKILAQEVEPDNIRVNCLQPGGIVDTALIGPEISAEQKKDFHQPSVVRAAAVWLGSDETQLITGRSIVAAEYNRERGVPLCPCSWCNSRPAKLPVEWRGVTAL